jgi:phosphoglycolate phosphatase-like HAD superfamily hydrolase
MKLVLFDIDGTLLLTDGAGRRAIGQALRDEAGTAGPIDTYRLDGKTDPQIVRDLLVAAGHEAADDDDRISAVCRRYVTHLERELDNPPGATRLLPGVHGLLDALEQRGDAMVGLLTGNLVEGAALKLRAAGLDMARFLVGAYGSDHADRPALPLIASRRAAALMGRELSGADVVIIGDTPADVTCGLSITARAIGVATGRFGRAELVAAGAYAAFDDLADVPSVLAAIYA